MAAVSTTWLGLFAASALVTGVLTALVIRILRARAILDRPNDRSSHTVPTPRGGGLAVIPVLLGGMAWLFAQGQLDWPCPCTWLAAIGGAAALAVISWLDDLRPNGLPARWRFLAQIAAVAGPLALWPLDQGSVTNGLLPPLLERVILGLCWLWFVNLYNFMDGINGLTGIETVSIGIGLTLAAPLAGLPQLGALLGGGAVGFLWWNCRRDAKIFLGDIGSIPLGYVIGFALVALMRSGLWPVAILLPLYHVMDATITLLKRLVRRQNITQPHREHFYQQAASTRPHRRVSLCVGALNIALIALSVAVTRGVLPAWLAVLAGIVAVTFTLRLFNKAGARVKGANNPPVSASSATPAG